MKTLKMLFWVVQSCTAPLKLGSNEGRFIGNNMFLEGRIVTFKINLLCLDINFSECPKKTSKRRSFLHRHVNLLGNAT